MLPKCMTCLPTCADNGKTLGADYETLGLHLDDIGGDGAGLAQGILAKTKCKILSGPDRQARPVIHSTSH